MNRRDPLDLFVQCRDPIQPARAMIANPVQRNTTESIPQTLDHGPRTICTDGGRMYVKKWNAGSFLEIVTDRPSER